jgi:WD40 repeat protein
VTEVPPPMQSALADTIERFQGCWSTKDPPNLDHFLSEAGPLDLSDLAILLRVDQRERWHRGDHVLAESYLARFPPIAKDVEIARDVIFNEYLVRERLGEKVALDEFLRRFPNHAEALRSQIELHQAMAGDFDESLMAGSSASQPAEVVIPGYEILEEIGRGGMGVIYKASQKGLHRTVALKMLSAGACAGSAERSRFDLEAEAVARLRHPNIVQIYDVGAVGGIPYLALEYMEGGNLTDKLAAARLSPRAAASLIEVLARAIHVAHEHGIVHRDLKPANILFTAATDSKLAVAKISDFGLAKDLAATGEQTASGAVLGTPNYMAPEQAAGKAKHVGPAADIYSLGAILYETLTGRPPFHGKTPIETLLLAHTEEPIRPDRLQRGLPADLVNVCLKALAKEPNKRYPMAAAFAEDLSNFLQNLPVTARPVTAWERFWRRCRRNPVLAGAVAAAMLFLTISVIVGSVAALVHRERNAALFAKGQAEIERERAENAERELAIRSHLSQASAYRHSGQVGQRFKCLAEVRAALALNPAAHERQEIRDEAAAALVLPDLEVAYDWEGWPDGTVAVEFDASLTRYARLTSDGSISLHQLVGTDFQECGRLPTTNRIKPLQIWMYADGKHLVVNHTTLASSSETTALSMWRINWKNPEQTERLTKSIEMKGTPPIILHFGDAGTRYFTVFANDTLMSFSLDDGRPKWTRPLDSEPADFAIQPKGDKIAVVQDRTILLLDAQTGKTIKPLISEGTKIYTHSSLAWHPDGRRLATACDDSLIHIWDIEKGVEEQPAWKGHSEQGIHIQFNPAGDRLLSWDYSLQTYLWDTASGSRLLTTLCVGLTRFSQDGALLGMQRDGRRLRIYRLAGGQEIRMLLVPPGLLRGHTCPSTLDGHSHLMAALSEENFHVWDVDSGRSLALIRHAFPGEACVRGWSPSYGWLTGLWASELSGVIGWPVCRDAGRPSVVRIGPPTMLSQQGGLGVASSADGKVLASVLGDRARVLNHEKPLQREFLTGSQNDVRSLAISPDNRWIATCSWVADAESSVQIWDARTGALAQRLSNRDNCTFAFFSPDGRWLVTSALGGLARLWEVPSWREVRTYPDSNVAFMSGPEGCYMALDGGRGQVRIVEPASNREVARLTGPEVNAYDPVAFTPDGTQFIAATRDRRGYYVWDLRAIRAELHDLDLDWDIPPYGPAPPLRPPTLVEVDRGWLGHQADFPDPKSAVTALTISLAFEPLNAEAHLQLGRALARLRRHSEAIAAYDAFLMLSSAADPRRAEILFRRANNHRLMGDKKSYQRELLAITTCSFTSFWWPRLAAANLHQVSSQLALSPLKDGGPDQALRLAKAACRIEPECALYQGTVLYREGRWPEALTLFEQSVELCPASAPTAMCFAAMCHHQLGDPTKAAQALKEALHLDKTRVLALNAEEKAYWTDCLAEAERVLSHTP